MYKHWKVVKSIENSKNDRRKIWNIVENIILVLAITLSGTSFEAFREKSAGEKYCEICQDHLTLQWWWYILSTHFFLDVFFEPFFALFAPLLPALSQGLDSWRLSQRTSSTQLPFLCTKAQLAFLFSFSRRGLKRIWSLKEKKKNCAAGKCSQPKSHGAFGLRQNAKADIRRIFGRACRGFSSGSRYCGSRFLSWPAPCR